MTRANTWIARVLSAMAPALLGPGCSGPGIASSSSGPPEVPPQCGGDKATSTGASPLASGQPQPSALAVDATSVYWTTLSGLSSATGELGGMVMKVPIGGGKPTTLATSPTPWAIAVDASNVYWAEAGCVYDDTACAILEAPLSGGAPTTLVASQQFAIADLAVTASHVYWLDSPVGTGGTARVMSLPLGGGTPVMLAAFEGAPRSIAVDSASVYWTAQGSVAAVSKVPLTGGSPVVVTSPADNTSDVGGVAVDATNVYWTATVRTNEQQGIASNDLMMVPKAGGVSTTLASHDQDNDQTSSDLVVDGSNVYWPRQDAIVRVPAGGGQAVTLAQGQCTASAVVVDATSTYWTDGNAGTVMRLARK